MPKGKKQFKIVTPRGAIYTTTGKGGKAIARIVWNKNFKGNREESFSKAQMFVDSECIRRMNPETPCRTRVLIKSATLGTVIGSGEINQIAPTPAGNT